MALLELLVSVKLGHVSFLITAAVDKYSALAGLFAPLREKPEREKGTPRPSPKGAPMVWLALRLSLAPVVSPNEKLCCA